MLIDVNSSSFDDYSTLLQGLCGDGASCKTTHMYESVEFQDDTFIDCKKTLTSIRHNIQNQLALYSYSSQLAR